MPATAEEVERAQALALLTTPPPKLNRRRSTSNLQSDSRRKLDPSVQSQPILEGGEKHEKPSRRVKKTIVKNKGKGKGKQAPGSSEPVKTNKRSRKNAPTAAKSKPTRPVKLERASSTELTPKTSKAVQECLGRAKTADLALSTRGAAATAKAKARPSPKQSPKPSLKKPKKDAKTIGKPCKADKEEHEEEDCSATASEESSSSDKKRKGSKTKRSKSPARQVDSDQEEAERLRKAAHAQYMRFRRSFESS